MDEARVIVEAIGPALHVINNNAKARNALSVAYYEGVKSALDQAANDASIAAVVLSGAGGFFCAGGDVNVLQTRAAMTFDQRVAAINGLHDVIRAILACPKPVIAAIEGGAAGAGVPLALACDMIVAAEDAYFSVGYAKIGLVPDGGTTGFLTALAPRQLVNEICMFGGKVLVNRLAELGAVNKIAPKGRVVEDAFALVAQLHAMPPGSLAAIKSLTASAPGNSIEEQLELEVNAMASAQGGPEAAEGIAAFLGKRKPDYGQFR